MVSDDEVYNEFYNNVKTIREFLDIGFNIKVYNKFVSLLFYMPFEKLNKTEVFKCYKDKKEIIFYKPDYLTLEEYKKELEQAAWKSLKKAIPAYNSSEFDFNSVVDYSQYELNKLELESIENNQFNSRKYQHIFAKMVKDRDGKCVICCEDLPCLLEAAHIKPHCNCSGLKESADINNGITLCRNHHKAFDEGIFTFNEDWTIKLSSNSSYDDYYAKFRQLDPCYSKLQANKPSINNDYLQFRNKNIFIH